MVVHRLGVFAKAEQSFRNLWPVGYAQFSVDAIAASPVGFTIEFSHLELDGDVFAIEGDVNEWCAPDGVDGNDVFGSVGGPPLGPG